MDNQELLEVVKAVIDKMDEKSVGTSPNFTPLHGTTTIGAGIFSTSGLEREIISTVVHPYGIGSVLPMVPSVDTDPRFGTLTGVSDDIGEEATARCGDAPTGYIKGCNLTSQFGRIMRDTQTIEIDQVMLKKNRGDFTDLRLIGSMLGIPNFDPSGLNADQVLNLVTMSEMMNVGVRMERKLSKMLWQGSPANGNGAGYLEFPGFSVQVATGQKDADTGTLCPSLDSDVKDFTYNDVDGSGSKDIVEYVSMVESYVRDLAENTGLVPVQWIISMRSQLWQELTAVWPCAYNTNKCGAIGGTNARVFTDGRENIRDRDRMRTEKRIEINGNSYEVVLDSGIFEHNNINNANLKPGEYASSIYFIPITINGAMPVTYLQYVDYSKAAGDIALLKNTENFWSDGGKFMWAVEQVNFCYKLKLKIEPRLVMRTPQLAARIDNVKYVPLQHLRDADPDSPYYVNGGVSTRPAGTTYAAWLDQ